MACWVQTWRALETRGPLVKELEGTVDDYAEASNFACKSLQAQR